MMFESIGPVWDGNEVWLVVAGGATFAAFPAWYATMFSGFYLALLLILVLLIVRVVSFEWREKRDSPRWRATWLWANTIGQRRRPVPVGRRARQPRARRPARLDAATSPATSSTCSAPTPSSPGIAVVALFALHGATYLTLRTSGDLCERAAATARRLALPAAIARRRVPRLDGRRRASTATAAACFPTVAARRARRDRAAGRRRARARAPQRLGLRGDRARRASASSRRSSPACIRACSSRTRTFANSLTIAERGRRRTTRSR